MRAFTVEDAAALLGATIAASGLLVHELGGPSTTDAIASLLIGVLLATTAIAVARPLADFLIGRSMSPARLEKARRIIEESPGIDLVLDMYAVHATPYEVILMAKVHPAAATSGDQLARLLDQLDQRLRRELPEIGEVFIDITAHPARTDPRPVDRRRSATQAAEVVEGVRGWSEVMGAGDRMGEVGEAVGHPPGAVSNIRDRSTSQRERSALNPTK